MKAISFNDLSNAYFSEIEFLFDCLLMHESEMRSTAQYVRNAKFLAIRTIKFQAYAIELMVRPFLSPLLFVGAGVFFSGIVSVVIMQ